MKTLATPAIIRTLVPILYALLIRAGLGEIGVDDTVLQEFVTLVVTGLVYTAIRFAEAHKAQFGWLLGYAAQPVYVKGDVKAVTEYGTPPNVTTEVETTASSDLDAGSKPPTDLVTDPHPHPRDERGAVDQYAALWFVLGVVVGVLATILLR